MALSIKNVHVEATAKELARITGQPITTVVRLSLDRELARQRQILSYAPREDRVSRALEIAREASQRPRIGELTDDEILGYDEFGIPTK